MPDARSNETRPSPDALLEQAEREERGRLRIFLGAAPGVGKTYEMLMAGRARLADGVDVVIGIVETHGRKETLALVEGYELIPRRQVDYKGRVLDEMDLDAILVRRPALVLVDELAHTNAPGSRHPKRYLDVQEILTHGIDVYTTLNIQHVESLNDVVAQITRVRVRETVPDSVIDQADDIEIIDLTPDDLIKRLEEGKVYFPNTAQRAIENYFSPGNLTALRELALRRTAQRVDEQLLNHMQSHAIPGPWAAGERVLVCVDARPGGAARIRYARRLADRLRAPWTALHVDTPRSAGMSEDHKDRLAANLRLAEQLGAEVTTIPGQYIAQDIVRYAKANNFTHIVIGRPTRSRWRELIEGSLTYDLIRDAGDISVHVISGTEQASEAVAKTVGTAAEQKPFEIWPYLFATAYVAGSLAFGAVLDQFLDVRNLAIVFLVAVLASAVTGGLWPALYACLVSALAFNYFFLEPRYTLTIRDPESIVALAVFLVVAVIASNLTARVQ
ncbi:sensor histidine kinase KdpD, partial [Mesorhizobium sp.]|uniref:sensor histidine kinase n=1 Tax=Mesorhizobium sp. TaxID=1871066 RepID=UPI0025BAC409